MPIAEQPQLNKQHPVPQNIMDVEFKLIGDLTMRQFAYLFVFGMASYIASLVVIGIFKWPFVITLAFLGLGLAFVPVEEKGLDEWIVNFIKAIQAPTQRVWKKEPVVPSALLSDNIDIVRHEMITLAPTSSRRKLEYYLDRQEEKEKVDPLDIPEREYVLKVREAFSPAAYQPEPVGPSVGVGVIDVPQFEPEPPVSERPEEEVIVEELEKPQLEADRPLDEIEQSPRKPSTVKFTKPSKKVEETKNIEPKSVLKKKETPKIEKPRIISRSKKQVYDFIPIIKEAHTGRKFVNLIPSQGELILPIRGEKVLKTSEQMEVEEDVNEKAEKLQQLLQKIRQEEGLPKVRRKVETKVKIDGLPDDLSAVAWAKGRSPAEAKAGKAGVKEEIKDVVGQLKGQNKKLNQEIVTLKKQIDEARSKSKETTGQEVLLKKLEEEKERIASSYTELSQRVQDLQQRLGNIPLTSTGEEAIKRQRSRVQVLTKDINIISGVVRDSSRKNLEDILLIIKNDKQEAIRAFKTDSIGQFLLSTPLDNGTYTLEVSSANRINLSFDIIPIEVKGKIIPPIEMVGKYNDCPNKCNNSRPLRHLRHKR